MNRVEAAKLVEQPSLGEAALKDALAALGVSSDAEGVQHVAHGMSLANGTDVDAVRKRDQPLPKTVSQVLGEITWLMTQSPRHKSIPIGDLEWLLMPAILLQQFRIFYKGEQPVGIVLWALADELVAKRIDAGDNRLTAVEWKSGSKMRIVELVAPFGGEPEMREQLK